MSEEVRVLNTLGELEFTLMGLERNIEIIKVQAAHLTNHNVDVSECVYCLLKDAKDQVTQARRVTHKLRDA